MKNILALALAVFSATIVTAADKKRPAVPPTKEQMQKAYNACVQRLTVTATNPESIKVDPIEGAWFKLENDRHGESIGMHVALYGQNGFGATIRSTAICHLYIGGKWENQLFYTVGDGDFIALGLGLKGMVQITSGPVSSPDSAPKPSN
jgi:hypothetical protein